MAKTKHTAAKSTADKASRKQLQTKAARNQIDILHGSEIQCMHWDSKKQRFKVQLSSLPGRQKEINLAEAARLLPKIATDYCLNRPMKRLEPELVERWGMYEAELMVNGKTKEDTVEKEHEVFVDISEGKMQTPLENVDTLKNLQISQDELLGVFDLSLPVVLKFIMLGDGKGEFEEGVYYGTSHESGSEGWLRIVLCTMFNVRLDEKSDMPLPEKIPTAAELWKTRDERWKERIEEHHEHGMRFTIKAEPRFLLLDRIDNMALEKPGMKILVDRPGSRSHSSNAKYFYKYDATPMLAGSTSNECVQVSLANALDRLGKSDTAMNVLNLQDHIYVRSLRNVSAWVHNNLPMYRLDHQMDKEELSFNYMLQCRYGIWIVNLIGSNRDNHVVAVDMEAEEILDGVEDYPMKLSPEAIKACVGDGSEIQSIDVRRLHHKVEGRKRNRSKPRSRKKKKSGDPSSNGTAPN